MVGGCPIGTHKVYRSSAPGLPVAVYDDLSAFKIYLVDVGLLWRLAQLSPTAFGEGNRLFTEFKGALSENSVLQTLVRIMLPVGEDGASDYAYMEQYAPNLMLRKYKQYLTYQNSKERQKEET